MTNYSAVFNCPGCGSPLETPEGTISLRCSYCGLIMRLGAPGRILKYFYHSKLDSYAAKFAVERYLKEKGRSLKFSVVDSKLFHLPFYRFRGMSYALFSQSVYSEVDEDPLEYIPPVKNVVYHRKCKYFDLTIPAYEKKSFGLDSLGIRPAVVPLTAMLKDNLPDDSTMLDISVSPQDAEQKAIVMFFFGVGVAAANKEYLSSEMIGEGLSIIYYPVWAYSIESGGMTTTLFIDGLAKEVYNEIFDSPEYNAKGIDKSGASEFNPVQHKCPNCGFDLPVSELSLYYHCENCGRSYMIDGDSYRTTTDLTASYEDGSRYHPFWRFPFAVNDYDKVGKFAKILTGEIPLIAKAKANNTFYLYVPAFRSIDLSSLTSLGEMFCRVQPILKFTRKSVSPSTDMILVEKEAKELARFYWNMLRSKYRYLTGDDYDFKICEVGKGEFVWLGLTDNYGIPVSGSQPMAMAHG